jgi:type VI secretion system protein ImpB
MAESTQHKLDRVRRPRVQITYDVEIGDAIEKKELPFLMGILADLSGKPEAPLPKLKERRFVEIDRDNFDEVLSASTARLTYSVENKLAEDGTRLQVALNFQSMEDFEPVNVLNQVPALAQLYAARGRLSDLLTKLDGNDTLDFLLQDVIENTEKQNQIKADLAAGDGAAAPAATATAAPTDAGDADNDDGESDA